MRSDYNFSYSKFFVASEFACPCGCNGQMEQIFMERLVQMRQWCDFGFMIVKGGGYRCLSYNATVTKAKGSLHTLGRAADIVFRNGTEMYSLIQAAMKFGMKGIGVNNGAIHVDDRTQFNGVGWTYYP